MGEVNGSSLGSHQYTNSNRCARPHGHTAVPRHENSNESIGRILVTRTEVFVNVKSAPRYGSHAADLLLLSYAWDIPAWHGISARRGDQYRHRFGVP